MLSLRMCALFAALLGPLLPAQDPAALLRDLGDPQRGEAAEIALVQLGAGAVKPLAAWLQEFDRGQPDAEAKLRAVLRVIEVLGPDAAELQSDLDVLAAEPATPALVEVVWTRGSLSPYSGNRDWSGAFHKVASVRSVDRGRLIAGFQRHSVRCQMGTGDGVEALLQRLAADRIFERELVAELLGKSGSQDAVAPLLQRLADPAPPHGHDGLKHNGFAVPMQDGFRWRAAEAVLRLLPDDPRNAVALGVRALAHPHRSVRLAALQALGSLGPDAAVALPDLLQVARGDDPELTAEALKVLGMCGTTAPACLELAESLQQSGDAEVKKRAHALAARLRAMKVTLPPATANADAALAADVAALGGPDGAAAAARLQQAGAATVPLLAQRLAQDGEQLPDAVLQLLGRLGRDLDVAARTQLRYQIIQRHGDSWTAPSMSTSTGGRENTELDRETYAELCIGDADAGALAVLLQDENACVRLQAARRLAALGRDAIADPTVRQALLDAARGTHPQQSTFETQPHARSTVNTNLDAPIQAAAAAALVGADVAPELQPALLQKLLAGGDAEVVAAALQQWRSAALLPQLIEATKDARAPVAIAAAEAIGSLGAAGKDALPALLLLAGRQEPAVAAAANAALQAVRGG